MSPKRRSLTIITSAIAAIGLLVGAMVYDDSTSEPAPSAPVALIKVCDQGDYLETEVTEEEFNDPFSGRYTTDLSVCDPTKSSEAREARAKWVREQELVEKQLRQYRAVVSQELKQLPDNETRLVRITKRACDELKTPETSNEGRIKILDGFYRQYWTKGIELPDQYRSTLTGGNWEVGDWPTLSRVCGRRVGDFYY